MDEKRKRVTAPRIAAALSALLAGAALYTVSGSERQGHTGKGVYRGRRGGGQYNHGLYERKRPGRGLRSSHSGPQGNDGCPEDGGTGGKFPPLFMW